MEDLKKKYLNLLEENEFALIKSADEYFLSHYLGSPLNVLTNFSGTTAEALIDKRGKIIIFVDPRYHEQADFECKGVEVVKLNMGDSFAKAISSVVGQNKLHISESFTVLFYEKLKSLGLNLAQYKDFDGWENKNLDKTKKIFEVDKKICKKGFQDKFKILKNKCKARYLYVSSLEEIAYLTNLRSFQMNETSTFVAKLLFDFENGATLFCDDEIKNPPNGLKILPLDEFEKQISKIKEDVLINKNAITLGDFSKIKKPVALKTNYVANMASIKEKGEIEHYKTSFARLDKALLEFKKQIKAGLSECELKEIFENELIKAGAKCTSFKTILATSENSSSIHYTNCDKNRKLKNGDTILLDCGGYYEGGYATDITRVFACGENISPLKKRIYTAVLKAFFRAYHLNSFYGAHLDLIVRKILNPYKKQGFLFPHGLGHGIGIPVHQSPPTISSYSNKIFPIRKNMTHTIEPGLYGEKDGEKFGIRLENSVYCTGKGERESFSKFEFEQKLINYDMLNLREKKWLETWQNEAKKIV